MINQILLFLISFIHYTFLLQEIKNLEKIYSISTCSFNYFLLIVSAKYSTFFLIVGHVLRAREMSGHARVDHSFSNHIYTKASLHARKLGHLAAVYCIAFDMTGKYIFTVSIGAANYMYFH